MEEEVRKTYRLVAERIEDDERHTNVKPVCIDVQVRGNADDVRIVGDLVGAWLNIGPFIGSFVDPGTVRSHD